LAAREVTHFGVAASDISYLVVLVILGMSKNPEVLPQLQKEIENVIKDPNATPSSDELDQLVYADSVIREALRFFPIFPPFSVGKTKKEIVIDGKVIPANVSLLAYLYGTNQDANVYSNPEKFDPSRFFERAEDTKAKCPLFAYCPQGGGKHEETHRCAGEYFIRYVLKLALIQLVSLYQWDLLPDQDVSLDYKKLRPSPKSGVKISFQKKETKQEE